MSYRRCFLLSIPLAVMFAANSTLAATALSGSSPMTLQAASAINANQQAGLSKALDTLNLSGTARQAAISDFNKLPVEAQRVALARISPTYAVAVGLPSASARFKINASLVHAQIPPSIESFYPMEAIPGQWVTISGGQLDANCKAFMDGAECPSDTWLGLLVFQVTSTAALGVNHPVYVHDNALNLDSGAEQFPVIAYRGYSGVNGWKFGNFSTSTMSWAIFRDYFTPSQVEYTDGRHKAAAQAWYDYPYKYVGSGGGCYGMTIRSIRTMRHDWRGLHSTWWPANTQSRVWDYGRIDPQILDSVREDQGGQFCAQSAALICERRCYQTNNQAWEFIRDNLASGDSSRQPVMVMWKGGGGHAIVAYRVEEAGDDRIVHAYDNNWPYSTSEAGTSNRIAHVSKSANSFSYGSFPRLTAARFDELVYDLPLLPSCAGGSAGGLASECTIIVSESSTAVKQITDQAGHTFFAGNQENANPSTRIPDSMKFVPLTGGDVPPNFPGVYVFNHSAGKSLTFDVQQSSPSTVRIFSPGIVTSLLCQTGRFQIRNILRTEQELQLTNPNQMNLGEINIISVQQNNTERTFQIQDLRGIQQQGSIGVQIGPSGGAVSVIGDCGAQLRMTLRNLSNAGTQQTQLQNMSIPPNQRGLVNPQNWNNLQSAPPSVQILSK